MFPISLGAIIEQGRLTMLAITSDFGNLAFFELLLGFDTILGVMSQS